MNFDGVLGDFNAPIAGYNDWANLHLNQVGSRRNIGVWFFADGFPYIGPASLDMGRFDFGRFDFGRFDFGRFDFGRFDFGRFDFGDLNVGDLGRFDFGRFDFGRFDFGAGAGDLGRGADGKGGFGRFDFGRFDFGGGADGELTFDIAVAAGLLGPPTNFTVCAVGDPADPGCDDGDPGNQSSRVLLLWGAPDASPSEYVVYRRAEGEATFVEVGTVDPAIGVGGDFAVVDASIVGGTTYTYYVTARRESDGDVNESASDTKTVTGLDLIPPVIAPHSDVGAEAIGPGGVNVNYVSPSTSDNVDPDGVASCAPASTSAACSCWAPRRCSAMRRTWPAMTRSRPRSS